MMQCSCTTNFFLLMFIGYQRNINETHVSKENSGIVNDENLEPAVELNLEDHPASTPSCKLLLFTATTKNIFIVKLCFGDYTHQYQLHSDGAKNAVSLYEIRSYKVLSLLSSSAGANLLEKSTNLSVSGSSRKSATCKPG